MARKTNYKFERNNRAKAKSAKREAKRQAKLASKAEKASTTTAESPIDASPEPGGEAESADRDHRDEAGTPNAN